MQHMLHAHTKSKFLQIISLTANGTPEYGMLPMPEYVERHQFHLWA
jgi:hypothetical protein